MAPTGKLGVASAPLGVRTDRIPRHGCQQHAVGLTGRVAECGLRRGTGFKVQPDEGLEGGRLAREGGEPVGAARRDGELADLEGFGVVASGAGGGRVRGPEPEACRAASIAAGDRPSKVASTAL